MNLIRLGGRSINLDLVALIEDRRVASAGDGVTVTLAIGGSIEFDGAEAEALRRFVARFSRAPDEVQDGGGPVCGGASDQPPAGPTDSSGTIPYHLDRGDDLPGTREGPERKQGR